MKIYIRNDLNMRKGKIAAQSAHAALGFWLDKMIKSKNKFTLNNTNLIAYKDWIKKGRPIEIIPVNEESCLTKISAKNPKNSYLIVDHGRTEFKGEPTATCLAVVDGYEFQSYPIPEDIKTIGNNNYLSKQSFIANKDIKIDKWDLAEHISRLSIETIFKNSYESDGELIIPIQNKGLQYWLLGAFAKIVLQSDTENLLKTINDLKNNDQILFKESYLNGEILCLCIGADLSTNIQPYTEKFKLF